jgi:uncharacterized C2H2 Zn-finger protein
MTSPKAWRFRRCPECHLVSAAGDYSVVGSFRPGWNQYGTIRRRCPHCGYVARSAAFTVVRERHAGAKSR